MPRSAQWGASPVKTPVLQVEADGDRKRPRPESSTTSEDSDSDTEVMDGLDDDATVPLTQNGDDDTVQPTQDDDDATLPDEEPEDPSKAMRTFDMTVDGAAFRGFAFSVLASDRAIDQFVAERQGWLQRIGSLALGSVKFATLVVIDRSLVPPPGQEGSYRVLVYARYDVEVARVGISETPEMIITQPPDTELEMPSVTMFVNVLRETRLGRPSFPIVDLLGLSSFGFDTGARIRLESRYTETWFNNPPVFSMDEQPDAKMENTFFASRDDSGTIAYLTF